MFAASHPSVCFWLQLLTRSLQFQTNPYTAMREGGGAAGGGGGGGGAAGAGDIGGGAWGGGAGSLPPTASYYSYDHPSLAAYRYVSVSVIEINLNKIQMCSHKNILPFFFEQMETATVSIHLCSLPSLGRAKAINLN